MTTHGRGGVTRAWLGSSADAMVRESHVPVLLVRPEKMGGEEVGKERFERVLIPLDGSKAAEQVVPHAVAVGGKEASYELVKVTTPDNISPEDAKGYGFQTGQDNVLIERKRVTEYLEGIAARLREEGYDVSTDVIGALRPARGSWTMRPRAVPTSSRSPRKGEAGCAGSLLAASPTRSCAAPRSPSSPSGPSRRSASGIDHNSEFEEARCS